MASSNIYYSNITWDMHQRFNHPVHQRWRELQKKDCSICSKNGEKPPLISILTEGTDHSQKICHFFHNKCIEGWVKECENKKTEPSCPLCQRKIAVINPTQDQETLCAAQNGDFKTAFELLDFWPISREVIIEVAILAIKSEVLKAEKKPVLKNNAGEVLKYAARNNQLTLLKIYLGQFRQEISREAMISAIKEASERGHMQIVKELMALKKFEIGELISSIRLAAKGGYIDTVMELLKDESAPHYKGYAVFAALVSGQLEVAQELLNDPLSSKEIRGVACQIAVAEKRTEILKQLLKGEEIAEKYLVDAFMWTCSNGNLEALTELLQLGKISAPHLCEGLAEAVSASYGKTNQYLEVVKKLLQTGKISDEAIGKALVDNVYYTGGDVAVLTELLQTGKVLKEYRLSAIETAKRFHSPQEIIDLLSKYKGK